MSCRSMDRKLSFLGERQIIKKISRIIESDITDDCASIDFNDNYLLITTDIINEITHIPKNANSYDIGWHIVAVNLSDIASDGGVPIGILLSFGLNRNYHWEKLRDIIRGASICAKKYNTKIIGGDTKENKILTIAGTAIGIVKKDIRMHRKGANVGDIICVTGKLGRAKSALILNDSYRLLKIIPRIDEGKILAETRAVTSCMDISDGLASSLYQLSELNHVGFEIIEDCIPIYKKAINLSLDYNIPIEYFYLYSGGDYELLFTVKKDRLDDILATVKNVTPIGRVIKNNEIVMKRNKKKLKIKNIGYEHFTISR